MGRTGVAEKQANGNEKKGNVKEQKKAIRIAAPQIEPVKLTIEGTAPLIMKQLSAKVIRTIEGKQQGLVDDRGKKSPRIPEEEYEDAFYRDRQGRYCVRGIWFKMGMMAMTSYAKGLFQKDVLSGVHVVGDLIPLKKYSDPYMVGDPVRVGGRNKTTTVTYRPYFDTWTVDLTIMVDTTVLSVEEAVNLLAKMGTSNGIGEWRPQRRGVHGTFRVVSVKGGVA